MTSLVRVIAPSRLHFGLLRFAEQQGASYGGLGLTLDAPRTVIEVQTAAEWQAVGPMADRALEFAKLAAQSYRLDQKIPLHVRVCEAPQPHSGLGTGTQLALAVALGIRQLWQLPTLDATELSASVGRGKRSAVGSHGFVQGGLIWETGQDCDHSLGTLSKRLAIPEPWRVLLITLPEGQGLHGKRELAAFANVPPVPPEVTQELIQVAESTILPATESADFDRFAEGVHHYGRLAGSCFASVQGGSFASPAITQLVDQLRGAGILGVGQSSWGPTVFALAASETQANDFADQVRAFGECAVQITSPNNVGAIVERTSCSFAEN